MSSTRNLFFLFAITLFALTSSVLAIFNYNPFTANAANLTNFYLSFFATVTGIMAITIFYIKTAKMKNQASNIFFWQSIRQAFFLSSAITILLLLKGLDILDLLIGTSVVVVFFLMELFFRTKRT